MTKSNFKYIIRRHFSDVITITLPKNHYLAKSYASELDRLLLIARATSFSVIPCIVDSKVLLDVYFNFEEFLLVAFVANVEPRNSKIFTH